jgi:hypothetical protein
MSTETKEHVHECIVDNDHERCLCDCGEYWRDNPEHRVAAPVTGPDVEQQCWHKEIDDEGICKACGAKAAIRLPFSVEEFNGVLRIPNAASEAIQKLQEKYDHAGKSPIILSWDDAYSILQALKSAALIRTAHGSVRARGDCHG